MSKLQTILIFMIGFLVIPPVLGNKVEYQIKEQTCNDYVQYFKFKNNNSVKVGDVRASVPFELGLKTNTPEVVFIKSNRESAVFNNSFSANENVLSFVVGIRGGKFSSIFCSIYLSCECKNNTCVSHAEASGDDCLVKGTGVKQDPFQFIFQKSE